jgi:hypothetical protein
MYFGIGGETLSTEKDSLDDFNSFPSAININFNIVYVLVHEFYP